MKNKTDADCFMESAIREAFTGMRANDGGPFGAVIVRGGAVIASAHNEVIRSNDPTAHAEIVAIRRASASLGRFDLSDCEIYSSCEPCPMCLSAIFWARIKKLYFTLSRFDAERIGFDDKLLYDVLCGKAVNGQMETHKMDNPDFESPFDEWILKADRVRY